MTFHTLETKLSDWQGRTEKELLQILDSSTLDIIQKEEARTLEQELWLIERLRCRIFFPQNRPRQDGEVSRLYMSMVLHDLAVEFIIQGRYGLCFFLKTRQAELIEMCTEERMVFSMAS